MSERRPLMLVNEKPEYISNVSVVLPAISELSRRSGLLMLFYINSSTGFTPAGKTIYEYTGITNKHLYTERRELESRGYIRIDKNRKKLHIEWDALYEASKVISMLRDNERRASEETDSTPSEVFAGGEIFPYEHMSQLTIAESEALVPQLALNVEYTTSADGNCASESEVELARALEGMSIADYMFTINTTYQSPVLTLPKLYADVLQQRENINFDNEALKKQRQQVMQEYLDLAPEPPVSPEEQPLPF